MLARSCDFMTHCAHFSICMEGNTMLNKKPYSSGFPQFFGLWSTFLKGKADMEVANTGPPAGSFLHILFMDSAKTCRFPVLFGPFQYEVNQVRPGAINPFCPIICMKIHQCPSRGDQHRHKHSLDWNCWVGRLLST